MIGKILLAALDISPSDVGIPKVEANNRELIDILQVVYFIAAAVAVLIIVISGIRYVISAGDPKQVTAAKNGILYSIVGLAVITIAFAVTRFIIGVIS